jgi:hypothetical protein
VVIYDVVRRRRVRTLPAKDTPHNLATYKRGIAWSGFLSQTIEVWRFGEGEGDRSTIIGDNQADVLSSPSFGETDDDGVE